MSQEERNNQIILFEDFIEFLRTHGYPIGIDTHLKVNRILEKLEDGFPAESLKTLLSPIFANSEQQQEDFYRLYDSFFEKYESHSAFISGPSDEPEHEDELAPKKEPIGILPRRWYYLTFMIILLFLVGYLGVKGIGCYLKTGNLSEVTDCVLNTDPGNNQELADAQSAVRDGERRGISKIRDLLLSFLVILGVVLVILVPILAFMALFSRLPKVLSKRRYYLILQSVLVLAVGYLGIQGIDCYLKTGRVQGAAYCILGLNDPFAVAQDTMVVTESPTLDPEKIDEETDQLMDNPTGDETIDELFSTQIPLEKGQRISDDISGLKAGFWQRYGVVVKYTFILGIFIALFYYEFYWRNKKKFFLLKERAKSPPFIWAINRSQKDFKLYTEQQFFEASRKLREREPVQSQELDLDKTIDETLESGGYPSLQYKFKSRPPEYLVLIEKQGAKDHQAMLFDQLMLELEQQDIFIERYFYEEDPRLCWKKRYIEEVYLEDLYRKYPDDRVIILGSVDNLFDPVDDQLCSWTHILQKWKKVAIVTPKCPLIWGHREIAISKSHVLVPATTLALSMLVDIFNQDQKISLRYWLEENQYPIPPEEDSDTLIEELEIYFDTEYSGFDKTYEKGRGKDAFSWLCMCSIYPEVFWDLTLTMGEELAAQRGLPLVTPENLFKIVSLSWFREGDMPDEVREALMGRLDQQDMMLGRKALIEMLKNNPPPKDSYAEAEHQLQIALHEAEVSPTISKNIKLIQEAQNYSINHEIKDFTVIKSLNSIPKSVLKVSLPQKISSTIFRQGIPALGPKTWVRGTLATALALIVFFTLDPSRLDRVHNFSGEKYFLEDNTSRMRYHTYVGNYYRDTLLDYDAARENYLKAMSLRDEAEENNYLLPDYNLAYLTWEIGNEDEAKGQFARISEEAEGILADSSLKPGDKKLLASVLDESKYNKGVINYRSQEIEEAEEVFRDLVKKDSNNTRAIFAEAVLFLQKALKTEGANQQNSFNLARNRIQDLQSISPEYFTQNPEFLTVLDSLSLSSNNLNLKTQINSLKQTITGDNIAQNTEIPLTIENDDPEEPVELPPNLKYLTDFIEGLALVEYKGKYGFIDQNANLRGIRYQDARPFSEGLAAVKNEGKWGFINKKLETVIPFDYEKAMDFSNEWASIKLKGKWGMINQNNEQIIAPIYDTQIEFEKNKEDNSPTWAAVYRKGKYEYINSQGELVLGDKKFQYAENFREDNLAVVKRWDKKFLINRNGECVPESRKDRKCPTEKWESQLVTTLKQHQGPVNVALYAPNGTFLLTASSDGKAIIYDRRGRSVLAVLNHGAKINAAVISPNNRMIATGGADNKVILWRPSSANSWEEASRFEDASSTIWSLAFSPDSRLLASGSEDKSVRLHNTINTESRRLGIHNIGAVTSLAFSPDGKTLVSGGEDKTVRFWNVANGSETRPISELLGNVTSLAFSPNGEFLAIGTQNKLVKVYRTGSNPLKLFLQFDQFRDWVSSVSFSGNSQYLLATSYDNRLWVWNFADRSPVLQLRHPGTVKSATISPDGRYVVTASWGESGKNQARVFKIETYGK